MIRFYGVPKIGLEPTRPYGHYTLNVARLPISPLGLLNYLRLLTFFVPRTRIELALPLQEHGPQPCASTSSATWAIKRLQK